MIVASCPLRISLVGGSTDHPEFIKKYKKGSVISFPSNLRTYITIHQDVFGINALEKNYNLSYSKSEKVKEVSQIQNELIRHCFEYLKVDRINCSLVSDIYSSGSGLASSSSYLQALVKAIYVWRNKNISEFEVCKIAELIERKFNPLVGQQDFYGSMGGLKRINFFEGRDPEFKFLNTSIFESMDIYLLYTGVVRNSTSILESIDISKSVALLDDVEELEHAINSFDQKSFHSIMNRSWENKKLTSKMICENEHLCQLDNKLKSDNNVLSHKLCGAGNGGYFLIFATQGASLNYNLMKQIQISETGIKWVDLKNEFTRV